MCLAADLQEIVPRDRWDIETCFSPIASIDGACMYTRFGAFISGIASFDASAFGTPRNEAIAMDPQQRLLLEETGSAWTYARNQHVELSNKSTGAL